MEDTLLSAKDVERTSTHLISAIAEQVLSTSSASDSLSFVTYSLVSIDCPGAFCHLSSGIFIRIGGSF